MKSLLFLFFAILAHSHIAAQQTPWLVITAQKAFNQQSAPLASGSLVGEGEEVNLKKNGYLGLLHESGYYAFLEGKMQLKLSDLLEATLADEEAAPFFSEAKMLLQQGEKYKVLKKAGSVTCGMGWVALKPTHQQIPWLAPHDLHLSWRYTNPSSLLADSLTIVFNNFFGEALWSAPISNSDTTYLIKGEVLRKYDEMGEALVAEGLVFTFTRNYKEESMFYLTFNKVNFLQGGGEQYPALLKILQAFYMEFHELPYDIETVYREAIDLRPQVGYEQLLKQYIQRKSK